mmetsp:Transcript_86348/g.270172  ORF Transcript_86348/g.270172 Transcript_86348/m.270172 type:complete len:268 (-) Transcript_86348:561-1364(-)
MESAVGGVPFLQLRCTALAFTSMLTPAASWWSPRLSNTRPTRPRRACSWEALGPSAPYPSAPVFSRSAAIHWLRAPCGSAAQGKASSSSVGGARSAAARARTCGTPFRAVTAKRSACSKKKAFPSEIPPRRARSRSEGRPGAAPPARARRSTSSRGTAASPRSRAASATSSWNPSASTSAASSWAEQSSARRAARTLASAKAQARLARSRSSDWVAPCARVAVASSPRRAPATKREKKASSAAYCLCASESALAAQFETLTRLSFLI